MLHRAVPVALLILLLCSAPGAAQTTSITIAWDANTEPDVAGYVVSWGTKEGVYTASADAGNVTQWTFTGANPDQRYYFVVQAYTTERVFSLPSNSVSNDAIFTQRQGTLQDQRPSVFWHNRTTGQLLTWHLSGNNVVDTRTVSIAGISDTTWQVAGIGDLNADGFSDILWHHTTEGWLAVWFLQNNLVVGTQYLSINRMTNTSWQLRGVGDVDGDRYADLVWHNTDGRIAVWFMRGATVASTSLLNLGTGANSRWQIATVGDINRDGFADIIWQTTDGWLAVWLLRGTTVQLTSYLSISRMVAEWRIEGAGYPDGGAVPALVWRNNVSGEAALWYMDGPNVLLTVKTNPSRVENLDWTVVGSR